MKLRLDKLLSSQLNITRSEAKELIKQGLVTLNGAAAKSGADKCDTRCDDIMYGEKKIEYSQYVYIMMNKPRGVISASDGKNDKTVVDILPAHMKRRGLFPAGRLDKDTTGFCLITDDGSFAHDILSPSNHVEKEYIAVLSKPFNRKIASAFTEGVTIGTDKCLEATVIPVDGDWTVARVIIRQGLYHQIKRMFKKYGINVSELKRIRIGGLYLDDSLADGECRYITDLELKQLRLK